MRRLPRIIATIVAAFTVVLATFSGTVVLLPLLLRVLGAPPNGIGSLAEWMAAATTLFALAAAASGVIWQVRSDLAHRQRVEADQDFIAALRVIAWSTAARESSRQGRWLFEPVIRNTGSLPIRDVEAWLESRGRRLQEVTRRTLPIVFPDGDEIKLTFPLGRERALPLDNSTQLTYVFSLGEKRWTATSVGDLRQIPSEKSRVEPWENHITTAWYFTTSSDADASKAVSATEAACKDFLERYLDISEAVRVGDEQWSSDYLGQLLNRHLVADEPELIGAWTDAIQRIDRIKDGPETADSQLLEVVLDRLEEAIILLKRVESTRS